jgi:hypothetical protein
MNGDGKSDGPVVPAKLPNEAAFAAEEAVEERGPAKGNAVDPTRPGRRAGEGVDDHEKSRSAINRIRAPDLIR